MIPIPISTPQMLVLLAITAATFFVILFLPAILEVKKPKDAGPRRFFESDGKEIVGYNIILAAYFRENSQVFSLLDDIESKDFTPSKSFFTIPLPDIEF